MQKYGNKLCRKYMCVCRTVGVCVCVSQIDIAHTHEIETNGQDRSVDNVWKSPQLKQSVHTGGKSVDSIATETLRLGQPIYCIHLKICSTQLTCPYTVQKHNYVYFEMLICNSFATKMKSRNKNRTRYQRPYANN